MQRRPATLLDLPDELLLSIIASLPTLADGIAISHTCTRLRRICINGGTLRNFEHVVHGPITAQLAVQHRARRVCVASLNGVRGLLKALVPDPVARMWHGARSDLRLDVLKIQVPMDDETLR